MATPFQMNILFADASGTVLKNTVMNCTDVAGAALTDTVTGAAYVNVDVDCYIADFASAAAATVKYFKMFRNGFDTGIIIRFGSILDSVNNRVPRPYKVFKGDQLILLAY